MALKKATEIATIDVVLVTLQVGGSEEIAIETSSKIGVEPQIETTEAQKLIVKGRLIAQKAEESTMTGTKITMLDNVFSPELVKYIQGGTIAYDSDVTTKVVGYTPPAVDSKEKGSVFKLNCYSARYNAAGIIEEYEKITYPNCKGNPVAFSAEDGVFRATEYVINSAPAAGEAPYTLAYVKTLPVIS